MARQRITFTITETNIAVAKRLMARYPELQAQVEKIEKNPSRADRLSEIKSQISTLSSDVTDLKDELQNWYDNLNEGLQATETGTKLEESIGTLDTIAEHLNDAESDCDAVEFPAMFGK